MEPAKRYRTREQPCTPTHTHSIYTRARALTSLHSEYTEWGVATGSSSATVGLVPLLHDAASMPPAALQQQQQQLCGGSSSNNSVAAALPSSATTASLHPSLQLHTHTGTAITQPSPCILVVQLSSLPSFCICFFLWRALLAVACTSLKLCCVWSSHRGQPLSPLWHVFFSAWRKETFQRGEGGGTSGVRCQSVD